MSSLLPCGTVTVTYDKAKPFLGRALTGLNELLDAESLGTPASSLEVACECM